MQIEQKLASLGIAFPPRGLSLGSVEIEMIFEVEG